MAEGTPFVAKVGDSLKVDAKTVYFKLSNSQVVADSLKNIFKVVSKFKLVDGAGADVPGGAAYVVRDITNEAEKYDEIKRNLVKCAIKKSSSEYAAIKEGTSVVTSSSLRKPILYNNGSAVSANGESLVKCEDGKTRPMYYYPNSESK